MVHAVTGYFRRSLVGGWLEVTPWWCFHASPESGSPENYGLLVLGFLGWLCRMRLPQIAWHTCALVLLPASACARCSCLRHDGDSMLAHAGPNAGAAHAGSNAMAWLHRLDTSAKFPNLSMFGTRGRDAVGRRRGPAPPWSPDMLSLFRVAAPIIALTREFCHYEAQCIGADYSHHRTTSVLRPAAGPRACAPPTPPRPSTGLRPPAACATRRL
jgi:hypothetical protein